ncbi:MAG TPA: hypothetical protein VFR24_22920, partial [Candidatus Angelobacter sp.]|nr:hypothetical protein [Candidatus Angelobacter sp.]
LRAAKARSLEALELAIAEALAAVTAENAVAWFDIAAMAYTNHENGLARRFADRLFTLCNGVHSLERPNTS